MSYPNKIKVVVNLVRVPNPHWSPEPGSPPPSFYRVVRTQNTTEPEINDNLCKKDVDKLIISGVTVIITEPK